MNGYRQQELDEQVTRLQELLDTLDGLADPTARSAAQELLRVVIRLHSLGLADLLEIVQEAGTQPADTLLPRFTANPRVRGLLLLHDLHPEDLPTRARKAVERLRPHLGVKNVCADLAGVDGKVVRINVNASDPNGVLPSAALLRQEIEEVLGEMVPDAEELVIDGLNTLTAHAGFVPLVWVTQPVAVDK
ncbi:hypothetical protein ACN1C3_05005 [Pseudomonas sp. H11T01]|uniref:hypothetical protein n=1 Tax=Pseudomonas sp. H11T01 TaxID=3402749 RepID=UPI003ACEF37D